MKVGFPLNICRVLYLLLQQVQGTAGNASKCAQRGDKALEHKLQSRAVGACEAAGTCACGGGEILVPTHRPYRLAGQLARVHIESPQATWLHAPNNSRVG